MKQHDFEDILNGDLNLVTTENLICPDIPEIKIEVLSRHVKHMFLSFLSNEINKNDLKLWAQFICFRGEYICKDTENDEVVDFYTDMWEVLQMTSTPEIDYELTPETIRRYLKVLEKYED